MTARNAEVSPIRVLQVDLRAVLPCRALQQIALFGADLHQFAQ